jgi:hypothetical protein
LLGQLPVFWQGWPAWQHPPRRKESRVKVEAASKRRFIVIPFAMRVTGILIRGNKKSLTPGPSA